MANQYTTSRVEKNCNYCGNTIFIIPAKLKIQNRFYCNRTCKDKHHSECMLGEKNPAYNEKMNVICTYCGEAYRLKGMYRESKNRFCSKKCQGQYAAIYLTDDYAPCWKGGIGYLFNRIRNLEKNNQWRLECFIRDNYTCQICNRYGGKLHVHHIHSVKNIIKDYNLKTIIDAIKCKKLWDTKNGITLCTECHKLTHKKQKK